MGNVDDAGRHLVKSSLECLERAIAIVKPGTRFRDVGDVITKHASTNGLSVVRTYCGHGIGCAARVAVVDLERLACARFSCEKPFSAGSESPMHGS